MSGIFISYRRGSAASASARLLRNDLVVRFGEHQVLLDVDTIEPGVDFRAEIEEAVASCDALLAIIDPNWLDARDNKDRRRLDDENDLVRIEVATALERGVRVVPVLVQGAAMPAADDLPDRLTTLARRNASVLTHERWDTDIEPLLTALTHVIKESAGDRKLAPQVSEEDVPADVPVGDAVAAQPTAMEERAAEPVAPMTAANQAPSGGVPATEPQASPSFTRLSARGLAYVYVDTIETLLDASESSPVVVRVDSAKRGGHRLALWQFETKVLPPLSRILTGTPVIAGWGDKNEIKRTERDWNKYFPGPAGLGVYLYDSRKLVAWSKSGWKGDTTDAIVSAAGSLVGNHDI